MEKLDASVCDPYELIISYPIFFNKNKFNNYESGINLAITIKDLLEHTRGTFNGVKVGEIYLLDATEDYIEDAFIQKLTFNIEII